MSATTKPAQQRLWTRPLQVPSRSGNDAQETAILASIHSLDRTRLKRSRAREDGGEEVTPPPPHHQDQAVPTASSVTLEPLKPIFQLRSLSLDRGAIAPGLACPTAPFAKSARKKAFVSAIYYSECFLRNIEPREADLAAFDVQLQYTKWWVQSKKQPPCKHSARKRRRLESATLCSTEDDDASHSSLPKEPITTWDPEVVNLLKERMVEHLQKTGGDTTTTEFQRCLEQLQAVFASQQGTAPAATNGTWLNLTKPAYSDCQGRNEHGECIYTLGRLSFDMFRPTNLKCTIRAVMNNIRVMDPRRKPPSFPSRLKKQLQDHHGNVANPIRHYDIVVAFTIQANQTRGGTKPSGDEQEFVIPRPIRGLITNHGYMVDDPHHPNRSSIWFTGGSIEVQDEVADAEVWKQIFDESLAPRRDTKATANLLAAKLLLGAHTTSTASAPVQSPDESVPTMSYFFKRPIGGHGEVFCDALYADDTLRITQGHHGSIFVNTRVPTFQQPVVEGAQADFSTHSETTDESL